MPPLLRTAPLALLALSLVAASPFGRKKPMDAEAPPTRPVIPRASVPADLDDLWTEGLPFLAGDTPLGLGSLSAQNCSACHIQAHDTWTQGAHASAATSPAWRAAAHESGSAVCESCHLPLVEQHDLIEVTDGVSEASAANPTWSPTLATEGVTCAACHVREGHVLAGRPGVKAPHPTKWSPQFGESSFCASCHQLTWAGADRPLYDTYGEWERSPQGKAGVTCQACHMGPGASAAQFGSDHQNDARRGRGLTLLVELGSATIQRGTTPLTGVLRVQNTGAGHHVPTGSPFAGLRLASQLEVVDGDQLWRSPAIETDFVRSLDPSPPYATTADTRIAAGEERAIPLELPVDLETPPGTATLVVRLIRTLRGEATSEIIHEQRIPLDMD